MKNFWKKYKVAAVVIGYFLLLAVFIYGGIFTAIKHIRKGADDIQQKMIDNELDKKNLDLIPQLAADYEIFSAQSGRLDVMLRKESEIGFIKSLEDLAKETGNEISLKLIAEDGSQAQKNPGKGKTKETDKQDIRNNLPYKDYIAIQVELKGGYPELMKFLKKLENIEPYANVVSLDLRKEENQTAEKSRNPFIGSDTVPDAEEIPAESNPRKETLKSLIDLVVYIRP